MYPIKNVNGQEYWLLFQNNVRKYVFALQIDHMLLSMFCTWFVTLWKSSFHKTSLPSEITALEPPLPLGISNGFPWGGGGGCMDIFWNHRLIINIRNLFFLPLKNSIKLYSPLKMCLPWRIKGWYFFLIHCWRFCWKLKLHPQRTPYFFALPLKKSSIFITYLWRIPLVHNRENAGIKIMQKSIVISCPTCY